MPNDAMESNQMSAEKPHRFSKPQVTRLLLGADLMTAWRLTQTETWRRRGAAVCRKWCQQARKREVVKKYEAKYFYFLMEIICPQINYTVYNTYTI